MLLTLGLIRGDGIIIQLLFSVNYCYMPTFFSLDQMSGKQFHVPSSRAMIRLSTLMSKNENHCFYDSNDNVIHKNVFLNMSLINNCSCILFIFLTRCSDNITIIIYSNNSNTCSLQFSFLTVSPAFILA